MENQKIDECVELKNIQYQTMLLNNKTNLTPSASINISNIDSYLDKERESNEKKPWSKLSSSSKLKKIKSYIIIYSEEETLSKEQQEKLFNYLRKLLERKKLQRIKDVVYDIELGTIKNIPGLIFNKLNSKFTIKKNEKGSSLKNLAPPKTLKKKKKRSKEEKHSKNKSKEEKHSKNKSKEEKHSKNKIKNTLKERKLKPKKINKPKIEEIQ